MWVSLAFLLNDKLQEWNRLFIRVNRDFLATSWISWTSKVKLQSAMPLAFTALHRDL